MVRAIGQGNAEIDDWITGEDALRHGLDDPFSTLDDTAAEPRLPQCGRRIRIHFPGERFDVQPGVAELSLRQTVSCTVLYGRLAFDSFLVGTLGSSDSPRDRISASSSQRPLRCGPGRDRRGSSRGLVITMEDKSRSSSVRRWIEETSLSSSPRVFASTAKEMIGEEENLRIDDRNFSAQMCHRWRSP